MHKRSKSKLYNPSTYILQIMFGTAAYEYIVQQLWHEKLRTGYRYVHKMTFGMLQRATANSVVLKYS